MEKGNPVIKNYILSSQKYILKDYRTGGIYPGERKPAENYPGLKNIRPCASIVLWKK